MRRQTRSASLATGRRLCLRSATAWRYRTRRAVKFRSFCPPMPRARRCGRWPSARTSRSLRPPQEPESVGGTYPKAPSSRRWSPGARRNRWTPSCSARMADGCSARGDGETCRFGRCLEGRWSSRSAGPMRQARSPSRRAGSWNGWARTRLPLHAASARVCTPRTYAKNAMLSRVSWATSSPTESPRWMEEGTERERNKGLWGRGAAG